MMTTTEVTAPGLCDWCRKGNHSGHRQGLDGICVGCACTVVALTNAPRPAAAGDARLGMAQVVMGALGLHRMLLDPEALEVEHQADGRVVVEWDSPKMVDGRWAGLGDEVARVRMRSTFTVAHEELASAGGER